MNQPKQPQEPAEKARRYRAGLRHDLREIKEKLEGLQADVHEVRAAQMIQASIAASESRRAY